MLQQNFEMLNNNFVHLHNKETWSESATAGAPLAMWCQPNTGRSTISRLVRSQTHQLFLQNAAKTKQPSLLLSSALVSQRKEKERKNTLDVCHPSAEALCCCAPCVAVIRIYSAVIAARLPLSTIGSRNAVSIPPTCFSQQMFSYYSPECKQWFRPFTFPPAGKRLLKSLITRQVSISPLLLQAAWVWSATGPPGPLNHQPAGLLKDSFGRSSILTLPLLTLWIKLPCKRFF